MKKYTKISVQWFYSLLERGECDIVDFKEQLEDKKVFGKSLKNFAPKYDEMARDVVAFSNLKGGFLFVGIVDETKEVNETFVYDDKKIFELIKQIQDRTTPTITLIPHRIRVNGTDLLVLEIPFSTQMHRTSKGEYLIRCNDGNRPIEPHEIATIQAEKGLIVYDQKSWNISGEWMDGNRLQTLRSLIATKNNESPYLDKTDADLLDSLGMVKDEDGRIKPTTTGILFVGNNKALRELPFYEVKYIHYYADGTYKPYEYKGNIIEVAKDCFSQLKAEIRQKEYIFGLFREYVEDYSEIVIRELLINALAHRDISRQQIIEIRKFDDGGYLEFESPGRFPEGVTSLFYENQTGKSLKLDQLFVLSEIVSRGKVKLSELMVSPNISQYRLHSILDNLQDSEFIESTGKTSGLSYILHITKRNSTEDKIDYVKAKKQNKARQKEAILRYLDSIDTINNREARVLLKLQEKDMSAVSRLFAELVAANEIVQTEDSVPNNVKYMRLK